MALDIDVSLIYALGAERMALLTLEAARCDGQDVEEDRLEVEDAALLDIEGEGGFGRRKWARVRNETLRLSYKAKVGVSRVPAQLEELHAAPLDTLPAETISFLRPSRFVQSDQFETFANRQFGHLSGGEKVRAIMHWMSSELEYVVGHSDTSTTLLDTFETRKGVCRDYAHMMCGLARASHIPARYISAYGAAVDPPDFHAVVEVWLGDQWQLIDPTGMCPPSELVLIGAGRDAADVPFMETPDGAQILEQQVRVTRG